ncbi:MAG: DUF6457 domain-containing protein [Pseudonocardiales bacterium]
MNTLEEWMTAACRELGIDGVVDRDRILELTRDVAHGIARPAAPLTAYLIGLATGGPAQPGIGLDEAIEKIQSLIRAWPPTDSR